MKLFLLLLGLTMVTAQVLPGGFTELEVNDEKATEAAAAAVSTLAEATGGSNPVSPCGKSIDLVGVEKASSQVVAGTKYKLTLRLATHTGDDCATRVEKVCTKISVWEKLPFMCPGDRPCHELVEQENIECKEALDYTARELKQIIDEKEAIIKHKEATITNLEATIRRNEAEIQRNEAEIQRKEAIIQNQLNCPIDGGWSNFSEFGQCSATCGEGIKERTRTCSNPPPQHGGQQCQGGGKETENCVLVDNCPVQGGWSNYTDWSVCSQTCGNGTKVRSRTCTQPQPQFGGEDCDGADMESESCFLIQNCPPPGNVIFITGGYGGQTSTEVLDPAGSCSRLTSPLPDERLDHSLSRLGGDLVLCGGEYTLTSCISARSPGGPWVHHSQLTTDRVGHASVATGETIHVVGGDSYGARATAETLEDVDGAKRWKKHQLPNSIGWGLCAVEIDNAVYITGGEHAMTQTWKWNTDQQWTRLADMDGRGRSTHACAAVIVGGHSLILVAGGHDGSKRLRTSAIYDIEKNTWRSTGELNQVRYVGVMVNLDADVYMLGGMDAGWNRLNTVEKFNVATNEWVTTNFIMKKGRYGFAAVSVERGDYC